MPRTFQEIARELADAFTTDTRTNGDEFYKVRDDAPKWTQGVPLAAHDAVDGRLPCDWLYSIIADAAEFVAEFDDADAAREDAGSFANRCVDTYTGDLFRWASIPQNRVLCDEAAEEFGARDGVTLDSVAVELWIRSGQYLAAERVLFAVLDAIAAADDDN
jgi:hypothetical protein